MPQRAQNLKDALTVKGFRESKKKSRDHHYFFLFYNGKKTNIFTKISRGEVEIHDPNCTNMAHQLRLNSAQFDEFVACPLTEQKYLAILVAGRHLQGQYQAQRSMIPDKGKKWDVQAHCDKCNRTFTGPRMSGERESDALLRMKKKDFDPHQCHP